MHLNWIAHIERSVIGSLFVVPYAWVWCLFLGSAGIHVSEFLIRAGQFERLVSFETFFTLEPLRVAFGLMLFYGFRRAPTYLQGWAVFIFFIVLSRLAINLSLGETLNHVVIVGLLAVAYGLILISQVKNTRRLIIVGLCLAAVLISLGANQFTLLFNTLTNELGLWVLWLSLAALIFEAQSWLTRKGEYDTYFGKYLAIVFVPVYLAGVGLFYGYQAAPTFLVGWAMYNLCDVVFRAVNNHFFVKEPFLRVHALGMILITLGTFALNAGVS